MNRPKAMLATFARKTGGAFLLTLLFASASLQAADRGFVQTVQPFFRDHCVQCHGPEKEKGSLRVDTDEEGLPDDLLVGSFETNANLLFRQDEHFFKGPGDPSATSKKLIEG